jgi:DNA-binding HxlR family transcriptional regulator
MTYLTPVQEFVLSNQARSIYRHLKRTGKKGISAAEAMMDYGITSATLSRRICDLEEVGIRVERLRKRHPITARRYTRYVLARD